MLTALALAYLAIASPSHAADAICIDDITARATASEKARIDRLLQQIAFKNEEDPKTHAIVQRVIRVDKDSVYDRNGIKPGDIITTGCAGHPAPPAPAKAPAPAKPGKK